MVRGLGSARAIRLLPGAIRAVAARRALRAAVVVPVTFMFGDLVLHDANVWLFAALGSVTMLLFVEFDGSIRDRLRTHVAFVAATSPPRGGGRTFSLHSKTARRLARRRGASYDHV